MSDKARIDVLERELNRSEESGVMRYRPIPEAWKYELAQQCDTGVLKVVRDELVRVRRELERQEGMATGLERALAILRMSDDLQDSAPPAERR